MSRSPLRLLTSPCSGKLSGNARPGLVQHGRKRLFGRRDVEKGVDLVDKPVLYRHQLTIIIVVDATILIFEMPPHLDHHATRHGSRGYQRKSAAYGAVPTMAQRNKTVVNQVPHETETRR